jgi:trigger factor
VKKRFREAIRQQVVEQLVQEAFQEVVDREKLKVAAQPHIHHLKFEEGQPLSFELHIEVRPELKLDRTNGFRVTRPSSAVTDEQVQEQLDQLRDQRASWSPTEEKPREGDMVTVQLSSANEDGSFPEPREYRIVIGGGQAIPGVEEVILTLKAGESTEQSVRWPDDFPDENERGKTKMVRVKLDDVKRKSVAPLDDAFAREVGDFESLADLSAKVRVDLEEHSKRDSDANVRQQIVDQIVEANPFDVPQAWVGSLLDAYVKAYQVPEEEAQRFATEFRPVAVELLAGRSALPDEAVPLFASVAKGPEQSPALRAIALRGLARNTRNQAAGKAAFDAAVSISAGKSQGPLNAAWEEYVRDGRHASQWIAFQKRAEAGSPDER